MISSNVSRNTSTDLSTATWCRIGINGFFAFVIIIILLHFFQPDFSPLTHFMSEYVTCKYGGLLNIAVFGNFIGIVSLIVVFHKAYPTAHRSRIGMIFLYMVAITILTNHFPADLKGKPLPEAMENNFPLQVHFIGGIVATLSMFVSMVTISIKLKSLGLLRGVYYSLPVIAVIAPIFLLAQIFIFDKMLGLVGLGQRIFSFIILSCPVIILFGIRSGYLTLKAKDL